jgi:hypothetical protein
MFLFLNCRVRMRIEEHLRSFDHMCNVLLGSCEGGFRGNFCRSRYFFLIVAAIDSVRSSPSGQRLQEIVLVKNKGKGKGHPITGHQGPRGGVEI